MPHIDVMIEHERWNELGLDSLAQRAFSASFDHLGLSADFEISLLGCDDARISKLNAEFRGKPKPTNVLSWPAVDLSNAAPGSAPEKADPSQHELGDIALAFETCRREAEEFQKPFEDHVCHLLVHGLLHLLGYDHENDLDAALMEGEERQILAKMGIADPY
ncbi:MAG: rRNA maturation RNase YbeY [Pseudomonadota bacterium]